VLNTPLPFRPEALVGATLDGRYRIVSHIASGGMGAIFRAEHVHLRKDVAVKVLRPDLTASADLVERFRREAEIAATLAHENIVRVTDFGRSPEGWLFLAMEFLEGESLFERLRREGAMRPDVAVAILAQVCRGLDAAHQRGVIHRDLKPENVFLIGGGDRPLAKILDFGIAKITDPGARSDTQTGMVVGTPEYLSPEQAMGSPLDGRADIYSVGLIAWRMLVGRHPFQAPDARGLVLMQATRPIPSLVEARPELSAFPGLVAAVGRACAKDPADRPSSAGQLAADLEAGVDPRATTRASLSPLPLPPTPPPLVPAFDGTLPAPPPGAPPLVTMPLDETPVADPGRGWRRVAGAASLLLVVAAVTAAAFAAQRQRPIERAQELLGAGRAEEARAVILAALPREPRSGRLHLLHARALARLPGQLAAAVDAYGEAAALDPSCLDEAAYADLAGGLSQERRVADKAAQLLVKAGPPAGAAVLGACGAGPGWVRLRALDVARGLGIEARLDRMAVYGGLLADPDCEVRKASARRLGELGNPAALPRLREAALAIKESRTALGLIQRVPVCGADEAAAAATRIEQVARQ
jgi:serine/threonine-protein kinase